MSLACKYIREGRKIKRFFFSQRCLNLAVLWCGWPPNQVVVAPFSTDRRRLSWTDVFPTRHGWHFPYPWSASQQQPLLNNNEQNIKRTKFLFLVCGRYSSDETILLWEEAEHSETTDSPRGGKSFKFLCVFPTQPWERSPLLVCICPWRSFTALRKTQRLNPNSNPSHLSYLSGLCAFPASGGFRNQNLTWNEWVKSLFIIY